ncbi:non-hydrolyzing UDP-N-acetylglucosamine 2-epimerase [Tersicoccus phoenicis]|uniref:non-hydrolyzing UDP-N-acetylglucosamine 2-epimerase n=1 Tax=Tersicoccus phoenicis TaxID=554083 RepID=UPI000A04E88B|nr:UDP-N-acetylglucosamine 2-epimerase (non-hydrolyzing) [Tersicoccus phoenicis]
MFTVMPVFGTRPEAIKMAPIIKAIEAADDLECVVTVTGQHREMLDQVLKLFSITPAHDLNIIQPSQTLAGIMARTLTGLDLLFATARPDVVLVHGDTTTSTAAALAAFQRQIPVVHVEAGLRSGDLASPFPEEANRRITGQISSLHLAPTYTSRENLIREGVDPRQIAVTGNTVIDALLSTAGHQVAFTEPRLEQLAASGRRGILVTTHRRENHGETMRGIGRALARIARTEPDVVIVLPMHKNPAVRQAIRPHVTGLDNVIITEPLGYAEFTRMLSVAHLVLTDSGGVQEEAPSLGKPVLVMRENTERPEAVTAGTVRLIGTDERAIVNEVSLLLHDPVHYTAMAQAVNPYGDGMAAERSVAALLHLLGRGTRVPDFQPKAALVGASAATMASDSLVLAPGAALDDGSGLLAAS